MYLFDSRLIGKEGKAFHHHLIRFIFSFQKAILSIHFNPSSSDELLKDKEVWRWRKDHHDLYSNCQIGEREGLAVAAFVCR